MIFMDRKEIHVYGQKLDMFMDRKETCYGQK